MQNPSRSRSVIACPSHSQGGPAEPVTTVAGSAAGVSVALLRQGQHCQRESAVMEGHRADPETAARDRHGHSGLKLVGHHRQAGHQQGSLLVCSQVQRPGTASTLTVFLVANAQPTQAGDQPWAQLWAHSLASAAVH